MKYLRLLFAFAFLLMLHSAEAHGPRSSFEFIANQSQWSSQVEFRARMGGSSVYLEKHAFTWSLIHPEDLTLVHDAQQLSPEEQAQLMLRGHAYKVNFIGANENTSLSGEEESAHYYNFFIGDDESKWASRVPAFSAVKYESLWDGIGMRVYNSNNHFKYDFLVAEGADAGQVRFEYDGIDAVSLVNGDLRFETNAGTIIEQAPFAYQMNGTSMQEVPCAYTLVNGEVGFEFPEGYDTSRMLTIDPIVIASTLSGSDGASNYGHCAAFDIAGNIYTGAIAFGAGYPTTTGAFQETFSAGGGFGVDIAVSKLNPDGTDLIYASFLGGSSGDYPHSLIINDQGELYVYGSTDSQDYPTSANAYDDTPNGGIDIVVTCLNTDGTALVGSTYAGGAGTDGRNQFSTNYGDQYRGEIFLTQDGLPVIASNTASDDFPTTINAYQTTFGGGGQDAAGLRFNASLSNLLWSSYFGGAGDDVGLGIRMAENGDIVMSGTGGTGLPTTAGSYQPELAGDRDGFIVRFNPAGSAVNACTYFGTTELDQCFFIDLDNDEDVWVYGQSTGDMPIVGDVFNQPDGSLFVSKFNTGLTSLEVSSRIGEESLFGGTAAVPVAFLVDRCDNIYISGYSAQDGLPLTDDAVYDDGGFYLAAFGVDISTLEFGTYYPSNHVDGGTSRFDKNGIVYQGVCSGGDFPTNADAWGPVQNTGWDIGVFKMDFEVSGVNASLTASAEALNGCAPHTVDFQNYSVGNIFEWDFGDGSPISDEFEPSHEYTDPGVYEVRLISSDELSCNLADTAYIEIQVSVPTDFQAAFTSTLNCEDLSVSTQNETGVDWLDYTWDMGDGTIIEGFEANHAYAEEGDYTITLSAVDNGCDGDDEATEVVSIVGAVQADFSASELEGCGELDVDFSNLSNGLTYEWNFGDGSDLVFDEETSHTFVGPNTFEVQLIAFHPESCNLSDTTTLEVNVGAIQAIESDFSIFQSDCELLEVSGEENAIGQNLSYSWNMGDGTTYDTPNVVHNYDATGMYNVTLQVFDELCDLESSSNLDVNVQNEVTAQIGNDQLSACNPFSIDFMNQSAGNVFTWDFGDGSELYQGQFASHEYPDAGNYTVTLTVEGEGACEGVDVTTIDVEVIQTPTIESIFDVEQMGACESLEIATENLSIGENLNYQWIIENDVFYNENTTYTFNGAGSYNVELTVSEDLCNTSNTSSQTLEVIPGIDFNFPPDEPLCYYEDGIQLSSGVDPNADVVWSTGETTHEIFVTEPGDYLITATVNNCTDVDGITVFPVEKVDADKEIATCEGTQARLEVPYAESSDVAWCEGEGVEFIYVDSPGEYCFTFRDEFACLQDGSIEVVHIDRDARIFIPNSFTPNNDGINDVFKPEGEGFSEFKLTVWNRWGELVFVSQQANEYWNGNHQGGDYFVQDGLYSFRMEYQSTCDSETKIKTGFVNVLR